MATYKENNIQSQIFEEGVLNIFTDASINPLGKNKWDGCAGAIAATYDPKIDSITEYIPLIQVYRDCTNNIAELSAIELACKFAIQSQNRFLRINVFSDSEYSIKTLREWIFKWANVSCRNGIEGFDNLRKSDGNIVKNHTIIINIINTILSINPKECGFNIYHVKAHSNGDLKKVQEQFKKANKISINILDAKLLAHFNDKVDNMTRDILLSNQSVYYEREVVPFAILPFSFNKYKSIIGSRRF